MGGLSHSHLVSSSGGILHPRPPLRLLEEQQVWSLWLGDRGRLGTQEAI